MSNKARIIEELVSLEAWHEPLEYDCAKPMHVAVSFSDARYAGGPNMPVEFTLKLKRAKIVVICDPSLTVPRKTKTRQYPKRLQSFRHTKHDEEAEGSSHEVQAKSNMKATLSKAEASAEASGKLAGTRSQRRGGQTEQSEEVIQTIQLTYKTAGEEHHWECLPIHETHLVGTGHDGDEPLMQLKAKEGSRLEDLGVRVFIKCLADDLDVVDVTAKPNVRERFLGENFERRLRLAREVIRQKLKEAQLEIVELEPRFQEVVLADVMAVPE